jgi:hypothetical protein
MKIKNIQTSLIGMEQNKARMEAVCVGDAKWVVNTGSGEAKFEWISKEVNFSALIAGDTFHYKNDLYMKIIGAHHPNTWNAIRITDGKPYTFGGRAKTEVVVTRVEGYFAVQSIVYH